MQEVDEVASTSFIEQLLASGSSANVPRLIADGRTWTPLQFVVKTSCVDLVRLLLRAAADVNLRCFANCKTPLDLAAVECKEVFDLLESYGARHSLIWAVQERRYDLVDSELAQEGIHERNEDGRSPLWFAVQSRDVHMVTILLRAGADINAADKDAVSPMNLANLQESLDPLHGFSVGMASVLRTGHAQMKVVCWCSSTLSAKTGVPEPVLLNHLSKFLSVRCLCKRCNPAARSVVFVDEAGQTSHQRQEGRLANLHHILDTPGVIFDTPGGNTPQQPVQQPSEARQEVIELVTSQTGCTEEQADEALLHHGDIREAIVALSRRERRRRRHRHAL